MEQALVVQVFGKKAFEEKEEAQGAGIHHPGLTQFRQDAGSGGHTGGQGLQQFRTRRQAGIAIASQCLENIQHGAGLGGKHRPAGQKAACGQLRGQGGLWWRLKKRREKGGGDIARITGGGALQGGQAVAAVAAGIPQGRQTQAEVDAGVGIGHRKDVDVVEQPGPGREPFVSGAAGGPDAVHPRTRAIVASRSYLPLALTGIRSTTFRMRGRA